jgi:predicted DsbA family dithiol-disulfide isomerase
MDKMKDEYTFEINWLPFFLNAEIPEGGVDRDEYFKKKFGVSSYKDHPMRKNISDSAAEFGLVMKDSKVIPNTIKSHILVEYGKKFGKHEQIVQSIFKRYFENGEDIGDLAVLKNVCKDVDLEYKDEIFEIDVKKFVKTAHDRARDYGVNGVPFFIFNNKLALSGAQPVETFLKIFKKLF